MDTNNLFTIYAFKSRRHPIGEKQEYTWGELVEKLRTPVITYESIDEYLAQSSAAKTEIKDVGGYVAGELENGRRGKSTLINRQLLTIDADEATPEDVKNFMDRYHVDFIAHTTHSSTPEQYRLRWLFPLSRPVNAAEYKALADIVSEWVGADSVDDSTDQPERLMFWPSVSFDADYEFYSDTLFGPIDPDVEFKSAGVHILEELPVEKIEKPIEDGVLSIGEGRRNKTVFGFAATLRGQGLDPKGIRAILEEYNDRYCDPPLEPFELDTICRSVCARYSPGEAVASTLRDAWDDFNDLGEWVESKPEPIKQLESESLSGLCGRHVDAPKYVVDNLISNGITILASPPKFGKSWMCMDLAISVANGTEFMGIQTEKRGVIYLALEDGDYRLQERGRKVAGERPIPENLYLVKEAPILAEGLLPMLNTLAQSCENVGMIIIDTLQKVRGTAGRTEGVYGYDYRELGQLHKYALDNNVAVVLVHHLNKGGDDNDFVGRLNGSTGISGAADSIITLSRGKRGDKETKMSITGRDIVERTLVLQMDWGRYRWTVLGEEHEVAERREDLEFNNDPLVKTIIYQLDEAEELVDENAEEATWTCSSSALLDEVERLFGPQGVSPTQIGRRVTTLADKLLNDLGISWEYKRQAGSGRRTHVFTREII